MQNVTDRQTDRPYRPTEERQTENNRKQMSLVTSFSQQLNHNTSNKKFPINRQVHRKWGEGQEGNCPLLIMIKGQDMYFAPVLKFKKRILFI